MIFSRKLSCLKCGGDMRKDERVEAPAWRARCRSCGAVWAYRPLAADEPSPFLSSKARRAPVRLEHDEPDELTAVA